MCGKALFFCETQSQLDFQMNDYSNRGGAQPAARSAARRHAWMRRLRDARRGDGAQLFVPKNKEEQTFFLSSARVSRYFSGMYKDFLWLIL